MIVWVIVLIALLWFAIPELVMRASERRRRTRSGTPDSRPAGNPSGNGSRP